LLPRVVGDGFVEIPVMLIVPKLINGELEKLDKKIRG